MPALGGRQARYQARYQGGAGGHGVGVLSHGLLVGVAIGGQARDYRVEEGEEGGSVGEVDGHADLSGANGVKGAKRGSHGHVSVVECNGGAGRYTGDAGRDAGSGHGLGGHLGVSFPWSVSVGGGLHSPPTFFVWGV